jgi:hypothetical protein|tara:strand:- start:234043 stop:235035 length:993 start_codon:yes stop_codon:yes gene_type:complete
MRYPILFCFLLSLSFGGFTQKAFADFNYGKTCPTVEAALQRLSQERADSAANALKTGSQTPLTTPTPIPGGFQGYWSLPNCDTPQASSIYTKYFSYSLIYGAEACLQKVRDVKKGLDFTQITLPSDNTVNQLHEKDHYIAGFTARDTLADLDKSWDENTPEDSVSFKFHYCPAPNPEHYKTHAPGLKLIRYLDHALELCEQSPDLAFKDNEDCHHLLFVMADDNVDFELTAEEIEKALQMVNYLAFANHNGAAEDLLRESMGVSAQKAKSLAQMAITRFDQDGNGTLKRTELDNFYKKVPQNEASWPYFKKKFHSLSNIFPSFSLLSEKP